MKNNARERILFKAAELFYTQGVHKTGINQIIKEAKVAKASFYHHFPSKDDLIIECVRIYNSQLKMVTQSLMAISHDYSDFVNKMISIIEQNVNSTSGYYGDPVTNIRFDIFGSLNSQYSDIFNEFVSDWIKMISDYFVNLQNENKLPKNINTEQLARQTIQIYEGAVIMWKLTDDPSWFTDIKPLSERVLKALELPES